MPLIFVSWVKGLADGVVHEGDALFHIAATTSADVGMRADVIARQLEGDLMFEEVEII
ncbi:hypothetical protein [Ruegeria denitrificans]|uniref:hypothetical protein n=1 Tax=Ruegeria denitrificans TaxID=1715692 RepID=UPI000A8FAFD4|nr:hypothetical protein [Ruegeria denitrificans]